MDPSDDCLWVDVTTVGGRCDKIHFHGACIAWALLIFVHDSGWEMLAIPVMHDWAKGWNANLSYKVDHMCHRAKKQLWAIEIGYFQVKFGGHIGIDGCAVGSDSFKKKITNEKFASVLYKCSAKFWLVWSPTRTSTNDESFMWQDIER